MNKSEKETELKIKIPGENDKFVYGKLYGSVTDELVIFVHGLASHMDEFLFYNGVRYSYESGLSAFRFNLYDYRNDARKLRECTLRTHADDLDIVVRYFRGKGIKKLYIVGHSYGGNTIMFSQEQDFEKVVLWDPSYDPNFPKVAKYSNDLDEYIVHSRGFGYALGKDIVEEAKKLDWDSMIQNLDCPVKIINAGKSSLAEGGKKYLELASEPKERVVIEGTDHWFDTEGAAEKLFDETISFIKA